MPRRFLTLMIHADGWLARDGGWAVHRLAILGSGYDDGPAGGPGAGGRGFHGPRGCSFRVAGVACYWSGCLWQGGDPGPGGGVAFAQGQVAGIFSRRRRPPRTRFPAACRIRQRPGLGAGEVAVQGDEPQPGQQGRGGQGRGQPRGVDREIVRGELADAAVFPGADGVLQACVGSVGGVDVGELAAPAAGAPGQVGDPQGVPPSVLGLEQGELGAWVRGLEGQTSCLVRSADPTALRKTVVY